MKILILTNEEGYNNSNKLIDFLTNTENVTVFYKKLTIEFVKEFEFIISYRYRYIIKKNIIDLFTNNNIINLHTSYLPYNRGSDPNLWSILENTPSGVTIHLIDEGLDTGDILVQKKIQFDYQNDTLKSSYNKLQTTICELFIANWPKIKFGKIQPIRQDNEYTLHYLKDRPDFKKIMKNGWDTKIIDVITDYKIM